VAEQKVDSNTVAAGRRMNQRRLSVRIVGVDFNALLHCSYERILVVRPNRSDDRKQRIRIKRQAWPES